MPFLHTINSNKVERQDTYLVIWICKYVNIYIISMYKYK